MKKPAWLLVATVLRAAEAPAVTIDGKLDDSVWTAAPMRPLRPGAAGVPDSLGGSVAAAPCGSYVCVGARLPEPGGKVQARSAGRNPAWEKDATNSPEVEDRIEFHVRGGGSSLRLALNPWGAYRLERNGTLVQVAIPAAATISPEGWTAEAAIPASLLKGPNMQVRAVRIRSRRPLAPELRWVAPSAESYFSLTLPGQAAAAEPPPVFRPPALGNTDPPLEVGHVPRVPAMADYLDPTEPKWDSPAWKDVPEFELPRNEPFPRAPRYRTHLKWIHDGQTLALLFRVSEPEPLVAPAGGRDSAFTSDDHVGIYLATHGASFIEVLVNPVGAIRDSLGSGLRNASRPGASWNGRIETRTNIRDGVWIVRANIPLRECATALGETAIPREWRVLVMRRRAARSGEPAEISALPPIGTRTFSGPLRYRRMNLSESAPARVARAAAPYLEPERAGLSGEIAALDSRVWPSLYRSYHNVRTMLRRWQEKRAGEAVLAERHAWDAIASREDWERFRDVRLARLREASGLNRLERPPLDVRVSARHQGKGYRLENLVYQSRAGFYVAANLYLPADGSRGPAPAIVVQHSFHYPKTQGELHDMGELWARTGCAVLIPERLGFGERAETTAGYRQGYASRFTFQQQLGLIGDSHMGWMAWDLIRGVDLLFERSDIDRSKIILIGSVAGGAEPAAVAAALDPRIAAVVPFNYDHGRVRLDGDFRGEIARQINMSFVASSIAPRGYVRAFEFGWEGAAQPDFPDLWISAWERQRKIWGFYNAQDKLASAQAYGLIRQSMERVSHSWSAGPQHRVELYSIFERWFGIPPPLPEDLAILPDSELSVNPYREKARVQEKERRRPDMDLLSIPPVLSAQLPRRPLHSIAYEIGQARLTAARAARASLNPAEARTRLRKELGNRLGDVDPAPSPKAEDFGARPLSGALAHALAIEVEPGIRVPMLLLRPTPEGAVPVVVAVATGGKDRFLTARAREISDLLQSGIAVCIPDVRGTGETAPEADWQNTGANLVDLEYALGSTLMGPRLKDLRTVLAYLRARGDIDRTRIAIWGESFAPPNPLPLFVNELELEGSPQIQNHSDPLGPSLALLAGLYEEDVAAVVARGGLSGYLAVLEHPFSYVPQGEAIQGVLEVGDLVDVATSLAPRPLLIAAAVNGLNQPLDAADLGRTYKMAADVYQRIGAGDRIAVRQDAGEVSAWLRARLRN